jgi:hypothetical protein
MSSNPLAKHFRQPSIYIKLPSLGKFWPEGSLDLPITGELPVYPMTTKDEIVLRTPDALMNGAGLVETIQSCCPNVKNAWVAPNVDIDALLIAIRIASYGHDMDFDSDCPHCQKSNTYSIDLRLALDSVKCPDYTQPLDVDNLKIMLKPQPYQQANESNTLGFEEQRMVMSINESDLATEEKVAALAQRMKRLADITTDILTKSTAYIVAEDGTKVDNTEHIKEFYQNAQSTIIKKLQDKVEDLAKEANIKPYAVKCNECGENYEMAIEFNYSSFFGVGF